MKPYTFLTWIFLLGICSLGMQKPSLDKPIDTGNPFHKFLGEWTLQDDYWEQSWDGSEMEKLSIPNHFSTCKELNTQSSLLWEVNAPSARGHILWTYDPATQSIHHNSSFHPARIGIGKGGFDKKGNIHLQISFSGEPAGTYRKYSYVWLNEDEYQLTSYQYDDSGQATGNYYGGTFIRIKP